MEEICRLLKKQNSGSFKKLGNNASGLTRFTYITSILPNINNYAITEKADGERAFIINRGSPKLLTADGTTPIKGAPLGVFDCEYVNGEIYIFDILELNGDNVSIKPFKDRLALLEKLDTSHPIYCKKYYKLSVSKYQKDMMTVFKLKKSYKIDGIIFTSINDNYNTTKNFKWKPPKNLTIDFLYQNNRLNVGISKRAWNQYGFPLASSAVHARGIPQNADYFPVPFVCSFGDYSKPIFTSKPIFMSEPVIKEPQILELSWNNAKNAWDFHRIREDRMKELSTGSYYGNNYKIAEETLQSSLNPLTINDLVMPYEILKKDFYFSKKDDVYKSVRKFNNYVKNILIKQYASRAAAVLDLASGKGQDLQKYADADVKELFMNDIDINAIDELLRRKYDILGRFPSHKKLILHIRNLDLNKPWKNNAEILTIGKTYDVIFCNFALHYMLNNSDQMENICALISSLLKKNGEFIFTALEGATVFNLVKNKPFRHDDKYLIELGTPDGVVFKGYETIKVKLPCDNDPKEEPLINIFELDKAFSKHNMTRLSHKSFSESLHEFKKYRPQFYNDLNENDIKFIELYFYTVYKKL